jgi:hypothetical protein
MRSFAFGIYSPAIAAAAALLAACSASQPAPETGFAPIPRQVAHSEHPDRRTSWMSPAARRIKKLLYVSDWRTNDVFVYDYGDGTLVGRLTGINAPYGQCVDTKGNVWIASFGGSSVVEYAHGGSRPLKALTTDYEPLGCSVDPTTGNLAVAGSSNRVDVFVHAKGSARIYQSAVCFPFWAPGYDDKGNLYVQALLYGSMRPLSGYSDPLACELQHGGAALRPVHFIGFNIAYPGGIMWDGKHLTLTDQEYLGTYQTAIYRVKEDASGNLTAIGESVLTDDCDGTDSDVPQPFIAGKIVVGGNLRCSQYGSGAKFDYWPYPAGGMPKSSLQSPPEQPEGQSVSAL